MSSIVHHMHHKLMKSKRIPWNQSHNSVFYLQKGSFHISLLTGQSWPFQHGSDVDKHSSRQWNKFLHLQLLPWSLPLCLWHDLNSRLKLLTLLPLMLLTTWCQHVIDYVGNRINLVIKQCVWFLCNLFYTQIETKSVKHKG